MKHYFLKALILALTFSSCSGRSNNAPVPGDFDRKINPSIDGYVANENTAKKVAEAILLDIYGKQVLDQRPFSIKLEGDSVWIVEGVLKPGMDGGVAHIEIQKRDCKILKVTHGK